MRALSTTRIRTVAAVVFGVSTLTLAVAADEPTIVRPAYNTLTDEQEIELGKEAAAQIEKRDGLRFVTEPRVQKYVDGLVQALARTSRRETLPYSVKVVDAAAVNAFALPGGILYVNRGLLERVTSESELAGALGHELGHVVGRHGANNLARYMSGSAILRELFGRTLGNESPATLIEAVGMTLVQPLLLKYSRADELQADLLAYYNIQRAGWNPRSMTTLFDNLAPEESSSASLMEFFDIVSTHPSSRERKEQIREELSIAPPKADLIDDSDEFRAVQAELKKLPHTGSTRK